MAGFSGAAGAQGNGLVASDYQKLRSVGQAEISPDGKLIAYTIVRYDRPGRPWGQLWVMDAASKKSVRIGAENDGSGGAVWSPDGKWIAYIGAAEGKQGLAMVRPDGTGATFLAPVMDTNAPLPSTGASVLGHRMETDCLCFETPGPNEGCHGDPFVITRMVSRTQVKEIPISMTIAGCTFLWWMWGRSTCVN